jgi:hypothetical protein
VDNPAGDEGGPQVVLTSTAQIRSCTQMVLWFKRP